MTPCEKLGYKVGDKFIVIDKSGEMFPPNTIVTLHYDDNSGAPLFSGSNCRYNRVKGGGAYMGFHRVIKIPDEFKENI